MISKQGLLCQCEQGQSLEKNSTHGENRCFWLWIRKRDINYHQPKHISLRKIVEEKEEDKLLMQSETHA